jgi:hypothetical protein
MNTSAAAAPGKCPVCLARFRSPPICPRCGADLISLMLLATHAYSSRRAVRRRLIEGDGQAALAAAEAAQGLHATPHGNLLRMVCQAVLQALPTRSAEDASSPTPHGPSVNRKAAYRDPDEDVGQGYFITGTGCK